MELSPALRNLQLLLPTPIYVVGGAVRDALFGYRRYDVDLAGELTPKELMDLLRGTVYEVVPTSMKLGTVKIILPGEDSDYEYTTFRVDSYRGGEHRPREVKFSHDLNEDALRRDFTVNAIYWNVRDVKIEDPLNGREDLRRKTLRATRDPNLVLAEDGLRILRLARFAAENGFHAEENTYRAAKENVSLLKDVSPERLRDEFMKILFADKRHGIEKAHRRGLDMLLNLGAMEYLIPELLEGKGVEQRKDFHSYTVLEHILKTVEYAPPEVRLAALFHDIAKPRLMRETGSGKGHNETGAVIAREALNRLKFPIKEIRKTERLIRYHMYDRDLTLSESEVREFIQENYDIVDDLIALKNADTVAKGKGVEFSPSGERLRVLKDEMEAEGVPMCVKALKIGGGDLIALEIPEERRAVALMEVLKKASNGKDCLTKESQLAFLKKRYGKSDT